MEDQEDKPKRQITATVEAIQSKDEDPERESQNLLTGGRPEVFINWDKVETCMAMGGDLKMCSAFGGVHWNTLERRILKRYGEHFREVRAFFMTDRKMMALNRLWKAVDKGDIKAVIFANKAFNGLSDKAKDLNDDNDSDEGQTFKLAYDLNEPPPIDADCVVMEEE